MSVYALKPTFSDYQGYKTWRESWKTIYAVMSEGIRRRKLELKAMQRAGDPAAAKMQKNLPLMRADARKLMTLLDEAKIRWNRIKEMKRSLEEQRAQFPITINARVVDFHFNKVVLEFPWMPKWVVKVKGQSYYVDHLESEVGFSTRELEEGSTLGMIRFRNCEITLNREGIATLNQTVVETV